MEDTKSKLIEKSKEAFILAIELYNKPTIKYRVEVFCFFICNAQCRQDIAALRNDGTALLNEGVRAVA